MTKVNKHKLNAIRKKHNLSLVILHGSQAKGKTHSKSDLDIAVVKRDRDTNFDLLALICDLGKLFKSDRVDLVDVTNADPLLMYAVAKKSKLLSGEKKDYEVFLLTAFKKYGDYLPYLKLEREFVIERLGTYVSN
ncbi:nucleotidyltransferase domain-containing protein [Patescibacteria group bacterium]|nr:nucleotidyltransferase domain-containing protein [Patescibacteria group bacterium]